MVSFVEPTWLPRCHSAVLRQAQDGVEGVGPWQRRSRNLRPTASPRAHNYGCLRGQHAAVAGAASATSHSLICRAPHSPRKRTASIIVVSKAVRQLRGECGARQIKECEVALAHGNGGVLSSQATVIFWARRRRCRPQVPGPAAARARHLRPRPELVEGRLSGTVAAAWFDEAHHGLAVVFTPRQN